MVRGGGDIDCNELFQAFSLNVFVLWFKYHRFLAVDNSYSRNVRPKWQATTQDQVKRYSNLSRTAHCLVPGTPCGSVEGIRQ